MEPFSVFSELYQSRPTVSLERLLRQLLLRGTASRAEIGRQIGFSLPSVTLGTKWLAERSFVEKALVRRSTSKRPVEMLSLRKQAKSMLGMRISARCLTSDLLDFQGTVMDSFVHELPQPSQRAVFEALGEQIQFAAKIAEKQGYPLQGVAMSIDGLISQPQADLILRLNGLDEWVACSPKFIHPMLSDVPFVTQWTKIVCKLHGLAQTLKNDDRIAYVEVDQNDLHIATMNDGVALLGRLGTSGAFLHQSVRPDGPECFCGRPGCLDALLRSGQAPVDIIYGAIQRVLEETKIRHLGLEWHQSSSTVQDAFRNTSLDSLVVVQDGNEMERQGLALLAIEAGLLRQVEQLQRSESSESSKFIKAPLQSHRFTP